MGPVATLCWSISQANPLLQHDHKGDPAVLGVYFGCFSSPLRQSLASQQWLSGFTCQVCLMSSVWKKQWQAKSTIIEHFQKASIGLWAGQVEHVQVPTLVEKSAYSLKSSGWPSTAWSCAEWWDWPKVFNFFLTSQIMSNTRKLAGFWWPLNYMICRSQNDATWSVLKITSSGGAE